MHRELELCKKEEISGYDAPIMLPAPQSCREVVRFKDSAGLLEMPPEFALSQAVRNDIAAGIERIVKKGPTELLLPSLDPMRR